MFNRSALPKLMNGYLFVIFSIKSMINVSKAIKKLPKANNIINISDKDIGIPFQRI